MSEEALKLKDEGNVHFKEARYAKAIEFYTKSLEIEETPPVLCNRAFAQLRSEGFGAALVDANRAIELDPKFTKAYYRRASANLALGKYQIALADFKRVVTIVPKDKDALKKYQQCDKEFKKIQFLAAIKQDDPVPISETLDLSTMHVDESSQGPHLADGEEITAEFVTQMMQTFKDQKLIHKKYAYQILLTVKRIFSEIPNVIPVEIEGASRITVCGDTHGQFYDLLNIFERNGKPSEENPYVFNGDFVDRGSFSLEVVMTLFAWKCVYPKHMHMTRGNHEGRNMNKIYGFEGEVKHKYEEKMFNLFQEVFCWLPLATCINKKVFVVHGGLFKRDGVTIDDINKVNRNQDIPDEGLMSDMLWSDPSELSGRTPNRRGVGVAFGKEVTEDFLKTNGLSLVIRSHEVKPEGYEVMHDGKLCTIFSAPNYCDQIGNKGAYIHLSGDDMAPKFTSFERVPHPNVPPMKYAMMGGGMGGLAGLM
eukprot:TRINITY_DN69149_c0_g1_i1.p1 TRINITY_DN69149_c0_g1~~TRINITY_DN69149_c0_g1_i1.p1  ORF type:complete len:491 (+),score=63.61 TRINITY_DN69149_c0_g1_i1:34-1473(+)